MRSGAVALFAIAACTAPTVAPPNAVDVEGVEKNSGFSMTVPVTELSLAQGETVFVGVSVLRVKGADAAIGSISFSLSQAPAGLAISGELPAELTMMELPLVASASIAPGTYVVTLKGRSGDIEQTVGLGVTVVEPGSYSVSLGASMVSVYRGASAQVNVNLTRGSSLTGDVLLGASNVPQGMAATFSPQATTGAVSTLTLAADLSTALGSHSVIVEASHPDAGQQQRTLVVAVSDPPPTCTQTCQPAAPAGFSGPVRVKTGSTLPTCDDAAFPTDARSAYKDITNPAIECTCNCAAETVYYQCEVAVSCWPIGNTTCSGAATYNNYWAECYGVGALSYGSCRATGFFVDSYFDGVVHPFTCGTSTSMNKPSPTMTSMRACGGSFPQIDCASDQLCVPAVTGGASLCIFQAGDVACPATGYTAKTLYYDGVADTRACNGACSCAVDRSCAGAPYNYGATCSTTGTTLPGPCRTDNVGPVTSGSSFWPKSVDCAASGTPSGYTPSGGVSGSGPVTVCCLP